MNHKLVKTCPACGKIFILEMSMEIPWEDKVILIAKHNKTFSMHLCLHVFEKVVREKSNDHVKAETY